MARTVSLKRCEPSVICSFRKSALSVEVPRRIAADRDTAVHTMTPKRTASKEMITGFVEINMFIHSALKLNLMSGSTLNYFTRWTLRHTLLDLKRVPFK